MSGESVSLKGCQYQTKGLHTHSSLAGLDISLQEAIDHIVEFHQALILAQIIFGFAKCIVDLSV
jgi:hypothetical protein